eukprot:2343616-Pyramimonas_sp.AAC.1
MRRRRRKRRRRRRRRRRRNRRIWFVLQGAVAGPLSPSSSGVAQAMAVVRRALNSLLERAASS